MWNWISKLQELSKVNETYALATTIKSSGSTPRESGSKMIVLSNGNFFGTVGGGQLEHEIVRESLEAIKNNQNKIKKFNLTSDNKQCCGGVAEVFIEVIGSRPSLYIFGAGHIGQAVSKILEGTPFIVNLIDDRDEWINKSTSDVKCHNCNWNHFINKTDWNNSYAVIMTHSHDIDYKIVKELATKDLKYLGLIGSKSKWSQFKNKFKEDNISNEHINKITCPIGLNIGGKTPSEVAISLSAQLLSIHNETKI